MHCEDKKACKKRHRISCKNGSTCKWQSFEFLHRKDEPETELAKIPAFNEIVQDKIEVFAAMVNRCMDSIIKVILRVDQDLEAIQEKVDTIEEEFSYQLEEN